MRNALVKAVVTVTIVALLALWLFAQREGRAGAIGFVGPFLHVWHRLEEGVSGAAAGLLPGKRSPRERIRDLEAQLRMAQVRLAGTKSLRQQNAELRRMAALPPRPGWKIVIAEVIARDPVTWNRGFRIARGRADGVTLGCAVLEGSSVIGRVTECAAHSATVTTVASQACRLGVVLAGSLETGVLSGRGADRWRRPPACIVDYLPTETKAKVGDVVWTSGLGGMVPSGLVVGHVTKDGPAVVDVVNGAHARVSVIPSADFGRFFFVAVVCRQPEETPHAPAHHALSK